MRATATCSRAPGPVVIKNAAWSRDSRPVDEKCSWLHLPELLWAYLRHLFLAREMLFGTLATLHNVSVYLDRMRRIREAILFGDFPEYLALIRAKEEKRS